MLITTSMLIHTRDMNRNKTEIDDQCYLIAEIVKMLRGKRALRNLNEK